MIYSGKNVRQLVLLLETLIINKSVFDYCSLETSGL